jgi:hypothetical protein
MFSMNVHIPNNGQEENPHQEPDGAESPFNVFGIVVVGIAVVGFVMYWGWK